MSNYNNIFGSAASQIGFSETEEEKKKKKELPSQVAAQEQKATKTSYDKIFGGASKTIETATPKVPTATPTPQVEIKPPEEKKAPGLFDKIGSFFGGVVDKLKPKGPEVPALSPETEAALKNLKPADYQEKLDKYMKFPDIFPNPDFEPAQVAEGSAQLTPEGQAAADKFIKNPIDTTINAIGDALTYHPKALEILAGAQHIIEDTPYVGLKQNPFFLGIEKGVSNQYLGSSDLVKETLGKRLPQPVSGFGKAAQTAGEVVGTVGAFIAGGAVLKGIGFAKLTLPALFGILGQTSATSDTTLTQRIEKLPVDVFAGWLFRYVQPLELAGKSVLNKEVALQIAKAAGKGLGISTTTMGGEAFVNALIEGKSPKDAAEIAKTSAIIGGLFYVAGSATGLLSQELLQSKIKSGSGKFTPEEINNIVDNSRLEKTKLGENLKVAASEAQKANKNVQVDIDALNKTVLAKNLNLNTPEGLNVKATLVDKPGELPGAGQPAAPKAPAPIPPEDISPIGKSTIVYRGAADQTINVAQDNGITGGVSMSLSKDVAQQFADKNKGTVQQYEISKDAKVVNHSVLEEAVKDLPPEEKAPAVKQIIKDNKIDVVRFDTPEGTGSEQELRVVNADVLQPSKAEEVTLYHGENKQVSESKKTFSNVLEVKNSQAELLQKLADEGDAKAGELLQKNEYVAADKYLQEKYKGQYDAIKYGNADRPQIGTEFMDLTDGKFYAVRRETASVYAMQNRKGKYEEPTRVTGAEAAPAPEKRPTPISEKFYIRTSQGGFTEVKGSQVNVGMGLDTFVHVGEGGGGYVVTEGRTGLAISSASTKTAAIAKARETVAQHAEEVNQVIEKQLVDKGESPRYLESAIINEHEQQANQNLGGGNRPGQPADTIPESQNEPERIGTPTQEPSGEVAPGGREGSDLSVRERLTTRISNFPEGLLQKANQDWIDNYSEVYVNEHNQKLKDDLEGAFIAKWQKKAVAYVEPAVPSKSDQAAVNKEIEDLVAKKGLEGYSPEELSLLRKYGGSGGLERVGAEGRGLLDEYYTPQPIVDFMWDKVRDLQPEVNVMVEPSVGIGRFIKGAPEGAIVRGSEISKTSFTISKVLYPDSFLKNEPFESNFVDPRGNEKEFKADADLVIGNPPYGEHRGKYLGLGEEPKLIKYEDYFMKRGLNLLKDGGLLAYVIPSTFIRSGSYYSKSAIAVLGYLEDAYRLPEGSFGTTSIGTDIIFIRKSPTTTDQEVTRRIEELSNDGWFNTNPDKILGEVSLGTGRYGGDQVIGSLENAMLKARVSPKEIEDTIAPETVSENIKSEQTEIKEAENQVQNSAEPPQNRTPQSVRVNALNKKAQIVPAKKDALLQLNDVSEEDLKLWKSVNVTGELNSTYTAGFNPKTFYNDKVAVSIENGVPAYYPNVLYYQGDIYDKLDSLELFRDKINSRQYELQKRKLNEVLPETENLASINLQPISDWVKGITFTDDNGQSHIMALFRDFLHSLPWEAFGSSSSWEIEGYINGSIVNTGDKIQNIEVRKRRRAVGNSLFKRFLVEVLTPAQQTYLEDQYNRTFNAYYRPDYKQVPVLSNINATFNPKGKPGKHPLVVKDIQKEGAAFLATKGAGTLAYDVGVGKTMTAIIAINDVLKRGWAQRPLIVVPNGVYKNWINEISEIIPDVKINSLVNLGAAFKGDLKTLEIEPGTISIITYDGLVKLGFQDETYDQLTADLRDVMTGMNNTKRSAEKELANVEQQVGKAIRGTTDQRFFEDLGFDHLTIDEVHNFKNIFAGAKIQKGNGNEFRNVRGSSSMRGIKAYLMSQYVLKNNNNRNVFLLSATPFTNSPLEIYSILSLMGKKRLEEIGLKNVNDFMSMFMELKPTFVVKANQTVAEEDVIEKFQNLQQLQKLVTEFIDFRTGEEAGVDRPGKIKRTVTLSPTETQNNYITRTQPLFNDKDKGGAIVAITELQNITLSPYLSRFNDTDPSYMDFVENSPKVKFAVEAIAQTYKDNKGVGQIIYMPRGVDKFPLIKEYLVKEKGFKSSQVAEITGGMSLDAKQRVQQDFNAGVVKVLLGTEAIKEGVNLQEKSTDLYHLHLPWNPTDILQVEGRIWRQGNDWSNVRIHYPLIENSVDSFLFQKLETKEKRIKNLWSYKGKDIELGDLNFEDMKLDLITNPVIRVKAEKTFEMKKEGQKLEALKVERSFTDRKIIKVKEAELEQRRLEELVSDNPEDEYYKRQLTKAKTAYTNAKRDLVAKGIDVADLEKKSADLEKEITAQQSVIEGLDKKYETLTKEAEGKAEVLTSRVNNYAEHIAPISEDNKTFFVKRKPDQRVRSSDYKSAPGGNASLGGYADVESAQKTVEGLKAAEFPELLRLVQELTGETPSLKKFRRALGRFYATGKGFIKLHPDIFKDPKLANKVFAHELGHLADYLPDETLMRGNILGRIASLNKFLRGSFGEKEINNAEIRAELKDLSQTWKPFDELESPGFTAYRYSSKELYADAISVLFNDPALLKEKAPQFFEAFFDNLDSKPEFKTQFFELQDALNLGEEEIFQKRDAAMNKAYDKAEDTWAAKFVEAKTRATNFFHVLDVLFNDKNAPINRRVRAAIKAGANLENRPNPAIEYAGLNYLDGKIKNFVADNFQPVYEKAQSVSGGWNTLGKILQLERAVNERGDLANPGGYDKNTATQQLAQLEKHTDPGEWKTIQEAKELFRKGVQAVVKLAEDNKYYTPEMIEQMKANPAYATFQVIDYLDTYISSRIKHQVGTLKDIANPATSTVMKAIATMRAIEYNNAKTSAVDFHREFFKDEIEQAKTSYNGKAMEIRDPSDKKKGLIIIIRNGKAEGYYVDKDVANTLNGVSETGLMMAAKVSRIVSGSPFYRPLFTSFNLGFQSFNFVRDFMRYWKNVPDKTFKDAITSLPRAAWRYSQAVKPSLARARNIPDQLIKEMENQKILGLTFNDMFSTEDPQEKQIERVLQKVGILEKTRKRGVMTPIYSVLDGVEMLGNFIETLPKVAGYIELRGQMSEQDLAEFIRTKVGSPDFRKAGMATPVTNNIFMFSNAFKEGMKSDFQVATDPKTRGGWWWKTVFATVIPKLLMVGITLGLAGEWLKERMKDVSEYDKTNYQVIPIGVDEEGKTIYARVPQDETGRFIGGLIWKMSHLITKQKTGIEDLFQVIDYGAGQVPNLSPGFVGAGAVLTYLSGRNPYDSFRGKLIIPETEFKAGPTVSFPIFLDWLLKNQGLGIIVPSFTPTGDVGQLQKVLSAPVISNIFGRWVKVSDYGRSEAANEIGKQFDREAALKSVSKKKAVQEAVDLYKSGEQTEDRRKQIELDLIKKIVGEGPYKDQRKTEATNLVTSFKKALVKGRNDSDADSLIYAGSNAEKQAQLTRIYKEQGDTRAFRDFVNDMAQNKVISKDVVIWVRDELLKK